jgi:hypothetical protein
MERWSVERWSGGGLDWGGGALGGKKCLLFYTGLVVLCTDMQVRRQDRARLEMVQTNRGPKRGCRFLAWFCGNCCRRDN